MGTVEAKEQDVHAKFRQQQEERLNLEMAEARLAEERKKQLQESLERTRREVQRQKEREQRENETRVDEPPPSPAPITPLSGASHSSTSVASDVFQEEFRMKELAKRKKEQQEAKRLKKQIKYGYLIILTMIENNLKQIEEM